MPERIWYHSDGAYLSCQPAEHGEWQEFVRADLCASGQQVRAVQEAADRDADRCAERIAELEAALEKARAEAKRMDLARDQFLGERNMLAETLREIQRGDMTGMMELTEAEVAKARATWAIKRIGTPVAALTPAPQPAGEAPPTCVACEDNPKHPNIPCAVCGARPPLPSEMVAEALREIRAAVQDGNLSQGVRLDIIDKISLRALKGEV